MTLASPSQSVPGTEITAAKINDPVNNIAAVVNGNLDDTNISSISGTKIASDTITSGKVSTGFSIQTVCTNSNAVATGTTIIPYDDTIPQITEGTEFMTVTITPKSATSKLVIEANAFISHSNSGASNIIGALFQDAIANAHAVAAPYILTATGVTNLVLGFEMTAGTTLATTFRLRIGGGAAGTATFNGQSGISKFGTANKSFIKVTEYKA